MSEPGRLQRDYDSFENENLNIGLVKIGHSFTRRERPASEAEDQQRSSLDFGYFRPIATRAYQSLPSPLETFTLFDPPPELEGGGGGIEMDVRKSKYFLLTRWSGVGSDG